MNLLNVTGGVNHRHGAICRIKSYFFHFSHRVFSMMCCHIYTSGCFVRAMKHYKSTCLLRLTLLKENYLFVRKIDVIILTLMMKKLTIIVNGIGTLLLPFGKQCNGTLKGATVLIIISYFYGGSHP